MATRIILTAFMVQIFILFSSLRRNNAEKFDHQTQCPTNTKLIKLPDGTYDCLFCSTCQHGTVERIPCDHVKDTICSICKRGYLYDKANKNCTQCAVCEPDRCNDTECTDNTDTVCKACPTTQQSTKGTTYNRVTTFRGTTEAAPSENNTTLILALVCFVLLAVTIIIIIVIVCLRRHGRCLHQPPNSFSIINPRDNELERINVNGNDTSVPCPVNDRGRSEDSTANRDIEVEAPLLYTGTSENNSEKVDSIKYRDQGQEQFKDIARREDITRMVEKSDVIPIESFRNPSDEVEAQLSYTRTLENGKEKEKKTDHSDYADKVYKPKREFIDAIDALRHYAKSVGSLFYKGRVITVFRVGVVYVMTAYSAIKELLDSGELQNSDTTITFDEVPSYKNVHRLSKEVIMEEDNLDIVILKLQTDTLDLPDGLPLSKEAPESDLDLTFIAFGKYLTERREYFRNNKVISFGSELLKDAVDYISEVGRQTTGCNIYQESIEELKDATRYIWKCPGFPIHSFGSPGFVQEGNNYNVVCMFSHKIPPETTGGAIIKDRFHFYTGPTMAQVYKALKSQNSRLANDIFSV